MAATSLLPLEHNPALARRSQVKVGKYLQIYPNMRRELASHSFKPGWRRDEVFLVSKVLPTNASHNGTIAACGRSLKRLSTDRLDCYLLHWRGSVALEETFRAFAHLQRAIEHAVIPWCEKHKVSVTTYSPFGHGDLPTPHTVGGRVLDAPQVALAFLTRWDCASATLKRQGVCMPRKMLAPALWRRTKDELARIDATSPLAQNGVAYRCSNCRISVNRIGRMRPMS